MNNDWAVLDAFLKSPERNANCLKSEHLAGFLLGVSAAPQYVDMQEWLHFVLGDDAASYQSLMTNEAASKALFSLSNDVDELVFKEVAELPNNCAAVADLTIESPLSFFCDGLLKAHFFLLPLWDKRLQEAVDKGIDTLEIQKNLNRMLSVVSTLADPAAAIARHPYPEKLRSNMHSLKFELAQMVSSYGRLATLLNALIEGVDVVVEEKDKVVD
jgi:yecA family protein